MKTSKQLMMLIK